MKEVDHIKSCFRTTMSWRRGPYQTVRLRRRQGDQAWRLKRIPIKTWRLRVRQCLAWKLSLTHQSVNPCKGLETAQMLRLTKVMLAKGFIRCNNISSSRMIMGDE